MHQECDQGDVSINLEHVEENVELKILEFLIRVVCSTVRKCSRMRRNMREFFSKKTLSKLLPCSIPMKN